MMVSLVALVFIMLFGAVHFNFVGSVGFCNACRFVENWFCWFRVFSLCFLLKFTLISLVPLVFVMFIVWMNDDFVGFVGFRMHFDSDHFDFVGSVCFCYVIVYPDNDFVGFVGFHNAFLSYPIRFRWFRWVLQCLSLRWTMISLVSLVFVMLVGHIR